MDVSATKPKHTKLFSRTRKDSPCDAFLSFWPHSNNNEIQSLSYATQWTNSRNIKAIPHLDCLIRKERLLVVYFEDALGKQVFEAFNRQFDLHAIA